MTELKRRYGMEGLDERFLHDVLGLFPGTGVTESEAEDPFPVSCEKPLEPVRDTLPGEAYVRSVIHQPWSP